MSESTASTGSPQVVYQAFSGWDVASIVMGSICYAANIAVFILLLLKKRTFTPFRTRNIKVLLILQFCGFLYWILQLIHLNMPYLPLSRASCIIYEAWLMYFCGLHLYLIVVNYRIWILYWLLIRMRPIGGRAFYGVFACLCIPAILFPVLSTAIPGWVTASEGDRKGNCRYTVAYHIYFSFALYYLVAVAVVLSVLLRNVRKTFNEYRESMISTAGFVILAIVTGVTGSQYIFLHGWGRFIILTLSLVTVNLYFWISLSRPLYGYLFDRQNYLARFQETLAMDGLTGLQSSGGGTASRSEATAVKASVTGTETPAEAIEAEPAKEFSVYQNSVSDAELTNVRSLFAPSKPLDEKAYLV